MQDEIEKPPQIKPAETESDPLVQALFEEMHRQGVSARVLEDRTIGAVRENTILQWRRRSTPSITPLRLCFEALGLRLMIVKL